MAIVLTLVGIIGTFYAFGYYQTPNAIPQTVFEHATIAYPNANYTAVDSSGKTTLYLTPTVECEITLTFEAQGNFGADNPIAVSLVITDANISLADYYDKIYLSGTVKANNTADAGSGWLDLTDLGNGTYTASGVLEWPNGGPVWTWLLPIPHFPTSGEYEVTQLTAQNVINGNGARPPVLTIGPITDTESWQNNQTMVQLAITGSLWVPLLAFEGLKKSLGY